MPSAKISILLAGGGTGGHLWPGVALANEIRKLQATALVTFFVPGKPIDQKILSSTDFPFYSNSMRSLPSSPFQYLSFGEKFFVGLHQTANVFRRCQPNLVVGLGGYGALSACGYALHKGIPFVLLEANRVAGKVVRWFAPWSECVYSIAPVVGVDSKKIKAMGLPIRFSSCASLKNETKKDPFSHGWEPGSKGNQ